MKLAARLHLVTRLRTSGATIPLSHIFMTYRGAVFFNIKIYEQCCMYRRDVPQISTNIVVFTLTTLGMRSYVDPS